MGYETLRVKTETKTRLIHRMKYGDSQDSAVKELLDIADKVDGSHITFPEVRKIQHDAKLSEPPKDDVPVSLYDIKGE